MLNILTMKQNRNIRKANIIVCCKGRGDLYAENTIQYGNVNKSAVEIYPKFLKLL